MNTEKAVGVLIAFVVILAVILMVFVAASVIDFSTHTTEVHGLIQRTWEQCHTVFNAASKIPQTICNDYFQLDNGNSYTFFYNSDYDKFHQGESIQFTAHGSGDIKDATDIQLMK